jgi:hypothetical protein
MINVTDTSNKSQGAPAKLSKGTLILNQTVDYLVQPADPCLLCTDYCYRFGFYFTGDIRLGLLILQMETFGNRKGSVEVGIMAWHQPNIWNVNHLVDAVPEVCSCSSQKSASCKM